MAEKVLLILVDGMRPDSIPACGDGRLEAFFRSGAYSFRARTTFPPVTLPCHMSLFHSTDTERHGVYSNVFVQQNHPINGLIETLAAAKKTTGYFYTWEKLRDLNTPGCLTYSWFMRQTSEGFPELEYKATEAAGEWIRDYAPDFVFLYLGGADVAGHDHGWMTPEYLQEVKVASECIHRICGALPQEYSVIVTADHGGHGRNHGDDIPEDMTVPMVFRGARFPAGRELADLSIKDIAPTVTDLIGVEPDPDWEGRSALDR